MRGCFICSGSSSISCSFILGFLSFVPLFQSIKFLNGQGGEAAAGRRACGNEGEIKSAHRTHDVIFRPSFVQTRSSIRDTWRDDPVSLPRTCDTLPPIRPLV